MSQDYPYNPTPGGSPPAQPPERRSRVGCIVAVIAAVLAGFLLLCCGGVWWGWNQVSEQMAETVRQELEVHPEVQEHLGDVQSVSLSLTATGELSQTEGDVMVFDVEGSKANGRFIVQNAEASTGQVSGGTLRLNDGTDIPISFDGEPQIDSGEPTEGGETGMDEESGTESADNTEP